MRKVITAALFSLLFLFTAIIQLSPAQTRPRRVGQTAGQTAGQNAGQTAGQNAGQAADQSPGTSPAPTPRPTTNTTAHPSGRRPALNQQSGSVPAKPPLSPQQTPATTIAGDNPQEVGEADVVRVNTTLVTLPVSVMDRDGKFIPDLRQSDFHIYEDGIEQQIAYFARVETPFTVVLMIDTSRSTRFRLEDIQDAAIAFVDELRPEDQVMVISFDEKIDVLAEATSDRAELRRAIRRTRTSGGTRLYDAVDLAIKQRLNRVQGRKAVVLFTDGVDTTSRQATYASNVRDAEELDALIYPIQYDTYGDIRQDDDIIQGWPLPRRRPGIRIPRWPFPFPVPGGRGRWPLTLTNKDLISPGILRAATAAAQGGRSRREYDHASSYLRDLAQKTGARLHRADDLRNLAQAFRLIAEELRRQYSLGYYPKSSAQIGERRRIKVRTDQSNLVVRSRDSYIYNSSAGGAATVTVQDGETSKPELRKKQPLATIRSEVTQ